MKWRMPPVSGGTPGRRRRRIARWRAATLAAGLLACGIALAGKPPRVVPESGDAVVARLPAGYAALAPEKAGDLDLPRIEALLAAAARTGDSRLAARAEAGLARLPNRPFSPDAAKARAFAAQHRHDFATARRQLGDVLRHDPADAGARLALAQVLLVQGEIGRARAQCASLLLGVDASTGTLCVAAHALRTGAHAHAAQLLDRWLAHAPGDVPALPYALLTRAEAASRAGHADADRWFRKALAKSPGDVAAIAAHARHLRAAGRDREAVRLLAAAPATDGLRLQLMLAARALALPQAPALTEAQARRHALARAIGGEPELRDEAEYRLATGDASAALALALRNFRTQRDFEDVDILRRAALAARQPRALAGLQAWMRAEGLDAMANRRTANQSMANQWP